jgi:diguanylate cyclase (GGDEF)-like protein/PAS domain S-box-containing protein
MGTPAASAMTTGEESVRRLRCANALFTAQIEASPDGILVVDRDRRIVSFNGKFVELWKLPHDVVQSRSDERAVACALESVKAPATFLARLEHLYANEEEHSYEEIQLKDGRVFERYSSPLPIAVDEQPGRIFFFRDITERKIAQDRVTRIGRQDGLTGLANRNVFVESVQRALAPDQRLERNRFALLYLDLDHFKDVNDTLGHPAGDLLLQKVAERLQSSARESDLVARFGGDEFAVLESHIADATEAATLAERLQDVLRAPFSVLGNDIRIGSSIGVALSGPEITSAEMLLSQADLALYGAKSDGRGTYRFFVGGMDAEVRARVALVSDMREGLDSEQMFLVYQPQVEIATGRIVGLEALVRWRHPRRGIVGPGEFIPVAERSGLVVPLGRWVMRQACRQAKLWLDAGICPPIVAVNVSGAQFRTPFELETTLSAILTETSLPTERLELELTESVLMGAWLEQRDVLHRLRESGTKIAIDDFGTGFSSLQYLNRFPVDRLKIAQEFITDLCEGPGNAAVVRATIGLARELGLQVIAEGVETSGQLDLLRAWGCREVQGFYFSKPLAVDQVEPILRSGFLDPRASRRPPSSSIETDRRAAGDPQARALSL